MKPWEERFTFLLTPNGWALSPAYDLNPQEFGTGLSLNIDEHDNALDFSLAIEIAQYAGITRDEANEAVQRTKKIVAQWPKIATYYGISREEQELMSPAFKV